VDPDWEETQTVAPNNVQTEPVGHNAIRVSWTPILFTRYDGGYRVFFSTTSGGPYTFFDITDDKTMDGMEITGLNPDTTYYVMVQTRTDPNLYNQNTVDSMSSEEAFTATLPEPCECDFEPAEGDGDVDGNDLVFYSGGATGISLADFAAEFGRTNCPNF
jgi:hypothetical protein